MGKLKTREDVVTALRAIHTSSDISAVVFAATEDALDDGTDIGEAIYNALEEEMRELRRIQTILCGEVDG